MFKAGAEVIGNENLDPKVSDEKHSATPAAEGAEEGKETDYVEAGIRLIDRPTRASRSGEFTNMIKVAEFDRVEKVHLYMAGEKIRCRADESESGDSSDDDGEGVKPTRKRLHLPSLYSRPVPASTS